jgi:hypothetical protein
MTSVGSLSFSSAAILSGFRSCCPLETRSTASIRAGNSVPVGSPWKRIREGSESALMAIVGTSVTSSISARAPSTVMSIVSSVTFSGADSASS